MLVSRGCNINIFLEHVTISNKKMANMEKMYMIESATNPFDKNARVRLRHQHVKTCKDGSITCMEGFSCEKKCFGTFHE